MSMTIDEKNQKILALANEIFEDRLNDTRSLKASFSNLLFEQCERYDRYALADMLATFFHRCQIVKGAKFRGKNRETRATAMYADEAKMLHQQLETVLTGYLKPLVVKHAIEEVNKSISSA